MAALVVCACTSSFRFLLLVTLAPRYLKDIMTWSTLLLYTVNSQRFGSLTITTGFFQHSFVNLLNVPHLLILLYLAIKQFVIVIHCCSKEISRRFLEPFSKVFQPDSSTSFWSPLAFDLSLGCESLYHLGYLIVCPKYSSFRMLTVLMISDPAKTSWYLGVLDSIDPASLTRSPKCLRLTLIDFDRKSTPCNRN